jgi:hypothetical protein
MEQMVKPLKKQYGTTHMMLFERIKDHLTDYKTLDEIMPIAEVSRPFLIQRLRLLEDKNLLVSAIVGTPYKKGSTKAYKLK